MLTLYAGDTAYLDIRVDRADDRPKNLLGAAITWQLAAGIAGPATLTKSTENGGIQITAAAEGQFTVALSGADTAALSGMWYHEAQIVDAAGDCVTAIAGQIIIKPTLIKETTP